MFKKILKFISAKKGLLSLRTNYLFAVMDFKKKEKRRMSYDGKIKRLENLIAEGEDIKSVIVNDQSAFRSESLRETSTTYPKWILFGTKELSEIFSSPRLSSKFNSGSKFNDLYFSMNYLSNRRNSSNELEEFIQKKIDVLENALKELKKDSPKRSKIYLFFRHPLIVAILTSLFWLIVKLMIYLPRGVPITDIQIP